MVNLLSAKAMLISNGLPFKNGVKLASTLSYTTSQEKSNLLMLSPSLYIRFSMNATAVASWDISDIAIVILPPSDLSPCLSLSTSLEILFHLFICFSIASHFIL
jgi:hypothetical protein